MDARLVVSLSGVGAQTIEHCDELSQQLAGRGVPLSLLVAPGLADQETAGWVRARRRAGDAVLLHGFNHAHPRGFGRKAEFAALPAHEARLRLVAATAALDRVGLVSDGFAPPRWLVSHGTLVALRDKGFGLCAELTAVRDLHRGIVYKGRIQGLGRGDRTEPWWCYALVLGAARQARRGGLVRLATDAADLTRTGSRQALLDAVDIALHHGAHGVTYPAVLRPPLARAA